MLILDLNLNVASPGPRDGISMLKEVRQNSKTKNLPVIIISNYSEKDYPEIASLSSLGVKKVFLKVQNTPQDLMESVEEILQ